MELNKNYLCYHKDSGDTFEHYEVSCAEANYNGEIRIESFAVRGVTTKGYFKIYSGNTDDFTFIRRE